MTALENENPVLIRPKLANYYRGEVAKLREALESENACAEATGRLRKLIASIVLTPVAGDEGRKSLSIDLARAIWRVSCRWRQKQGSPLPGVASSSSLQNWVRGRAISCRWAALSKYAKSAWTWL